MNEEASVSLDDGKVLLPISHIQHCVEVPCNIHMKIYEVPLMQCQSSVHSNLESRLIMMVFVNA